MRTPLALAIIVTCALAWSAYSQEDSLEAAATPDSTIQEPESHSHDHEHEAISANSSQTDLDSGYVIAEDIAHHHDSYSGPKKLKIVERVYSYREQIGFALGMMAFLTIIFTTTQSWNPD